MNSLLKRQIRKYLPKNLQANKDLDAFLEAVSKSYDSSEEQFTMLQRAVTISSEELFETNQQLREETQSQKNIISKLNNVLNTLKFYELEEVKNLESTDSLKLVDFIDHQTKEIIEINKEKDKLVANLVKQNQELNEYAHMISHDLKSPLQSLDALTTWFREDYYEDFDNGGKEILNLIRNNVEKIDTLLQGILEYSTIGKVEKNRYEVNLSLLLKKIIPTIDNPQDVKTIIPEKLPTIYGDNHRLETLFYNLIHNAIKFNDKGKNGFIEINYTDQKDFWKFTFKDNGKGIENKYFDKIFVAFQKLENDHKSTGIGLSIVKKIIEAYNGDICIESTPNVETIFTFTIKK